MRATSRLITSLAYEDALTAADEDGFSFPTATSDELLRALEILTAQENRVEEECLEEEQEWEESEVYDWEELDAE